MSEAMKLLCLEPGEPPRLEARRAPVPVPAAGEVVVRVEATSVNPIDVKCAAGYGRRLLALKGAGRFPLVHGASGGLGQIALQVLTRWGASVTAVSSTAHLETCRALGAATVWDRTQRRLEDVPRHFDAVLNFGSWDDDAVLLGRLRDGALGYATTVHPLLANFDRHGWLAGAWRTRNDRARGRALAKAKGARYGWTVFRPDGEALDALQRFLAQGMPALPVGLAVPLADAGRAFEHVASQRSGRAVLRPLQDA